MELLASRIVVALFALAVIVPVAGSAEAPHLGIEISEPSIKVVDGPDGDGDFTISVKVRVKNTTETELTVDLIVQSLDTRLVCSGGAMTGVFKPKLPGDCGLALRPSICRGIERD